MKRSKVIIHKNNYVQRTDSFNTASFNIEGPTYTAFLSECGAVILT